MPVVPSSILGGQAASSTVSNLFSSLLVLAVAFVIGFRSNAGPLEWLLFAGFVALFTLATTWMAIFLACWPVQPRAPVHLAIFSCSSSSFSPSFVPTDSMTRDYVALPKINPLRLSSNVALTPHHWCGR